QARPLKRCASEIDEDREIFVVYYLDDCECEKYTTNISRSSSISDAHLFNGLACREGLKIKR
ncbi:hypothetical protein ACT4US_36300, partial [Bacillus sp. HC-Mk]